MRLKSNILKISELTESVTNRMFDIMTKVYNGETKDKFLSDMNEKNYVLVLYNDRSEIAGFTTIQVFEFEDKIIIYSGDTVIDESSRGDIELMRAWRLFTFKIEQENPNKKVLWLLISKGWRTYKFLPLFFKEYYPSCKYKTPDNIQNFIDRLSVYKFGNCYKTGLVIPKKPDMLKSGRYDIPGKRSDDKDVKFFLEKNPEFYKGNELVCLAELSLSNMTKASLRLLHGVKGEI